MSGTVEVCGHLRTKSGRRAEHEGPTASRRL
jgi:hypothetical protein